jgi:Ca2+-transporting ATPase
MLFMNTQVVSGRAKAVVVSTAMNTEVGSIAWQIVEAEERKSPFQEEADHLGQRIGYGVITLILLIGAVSFYFVRPDYDPAGGCQLLILVRKLAEAC